MYCLFLRIIIILLSLLNRRGVNFDMGANSWDTSHNNRLSLPRIINFIGLLRWTIWATTRWYSIFLAEGKVILGLWVNLSLYLFALLNLHRATHFIDIRRLFAKVFSWAEFGGLLGVLWSVGGVWVWCLDRLPRIVTIYDILTARPEEEVGEDVATSLSRRNLTLLHLDQLRLPQSDVDQLGYVFAHLQRPHYRSLFFPIDKQWIFRSNELVLSIVPHFFQKCLILKRSLFCIIIYILSNIYI